MKIEDLSPEHQERINKMLPLRIVLKDDNSTIQGRTELSFGMDWNNYDVLIFWSGKAYSMLGEHNLDATKDAKYNVKEWDSHQFIFDPLAEDCPIDIDWAQWLDAEDKYRKRNARFKVKPGGNWHLRAMALERKLEKVDKSYQAMCKSFEEVENKLEAIANIINPPAEEHDED